MLFVFEECKLSSPFANARSYVLQTMFSNNVLQIQCIGFMFHIQSVSYAFYSKITYVYLFQLLL